MVYCTVPFLNRISIFSWLTWSFVLVILSSFWKKLNSHEHTAQTPSLLKFCSKKNNLEPSRVKSTTCGFPSFSIFIFDPPWIFLLKFKLRDYFLLPTSLLFGYPYLSFLGYSYKIQIWDLLLTAFTVALSGDKLNTSVRFPWTLLLLIMDIPK